MKKFLKVVVSLVIIGALVMLFYNSSYAADNFAGGKAVIEKIVGGIRMEIYANNSDYTVKETEVLLQRPELPTGCESVALTMALESLGYDLEKTEIADSYMTYDSHNYAIGYVGDPHSENGAGIFPPGLTDTANNYLNSHVLTNEQGEEFYYSAYNISGTAFEDLFSYVDAGNPVLIWITYTYESPVFTGESVSYDGEEFSWYQKEHCVMIAGYNRSNRSVLLYDPLKGLRKKSMDSIASLYAEVGSYAMTIY